MHYGQEFHWSAGKSPTGQLANGKLPKGKSPKASHQNSIFLLIALHLTSKSSWHMLLIIWVNWIDTCHVTSHLTHLERVCLSEEVSPIIIARTQPQTQVSWPEDSQDLEFAIAETSIPEDFLQKDVLVDEQWHIIFAKPNMISILSQAKNWYIGATFKVVCKPFTQLFSVHAFVKSGENVKQVPLLFAIMSGKWKQDYIEVFNAVDTVLPKRNVQTITSDFKAAMWQAAAEVFPTVARLGCFSHWSQAVWRKVNILHWFLNDLKQEL